MKLKRHKQFVKDLRKAKMTDEQFQKLAKYLTLLVEGKPLPPEAKDVVLGRKRRRTAQKRMEGQN